jgi:pyruvate-ferredoxin/flavodoxin oxidoreductase
MRLAVDKQAEAARELLKSLSTQVGEPLADAILLATQDTEASIGAQRARVARLRDSLSHLDCADARRLESLADFLVRKSVWIVGGDGWAYDIGYGGLDHVMSGNWDVNILVLDTEVYSNTGGQQSKATPLGAAARFAVAGKSSAKKDLALLAMMYGHVYVGRVAFGARDAHTVKVFQEAESYPGPSLILAYSHCIAHGYDLTFGLDQQTLAVETGYWPLLRYDPRLADSEAGPLRMDSPAPGRQLSEYYEKEGRFQAVKQQDPDRYAELLAMAQEKTEQRYEFYSRLSAVLKARNRSTEIRSGLETTAGGAVGP